MSAMPKPLVTYYGREPVADLWSEVQPLLELHWDEIAHYRDVALAPKREMYERMDATGILRCYTARVDGELVGYLAVIVMPALHYDITQAIQDVLFVVPAFRRSRIGVGLLRFAERALRDEGVNVIVQHVKVAHDFGPLLSRMGYECVEKIFWKRLDHGR